MGCLSSKAITQSMSIREELTHGFHSTSVTWEDLFNSHRGNDQLFGFVCSGNSTTTKLRSNSFTLPSGDLETALQSNYLVNAWDLIQEVNGKAEVESAPGAVREPNSGRFTRSRSCQMLRKKEELGLTPEADRLEQNKLHWNDKNLSGSRSFHTVQEYDALLERIHKFSTGSAETCGDCHPWEDEKLQQSNSLGERQDDRPLQRPTHDCLDKDPGIRNDINSDDYDKFENVVQDSETGWKRKSAAKRLHSLDLSTIEFPDIARFRQQIHAEGQVYSPGTYVTPKFESYNAKVTPAAKEKEGGENSVFSLELVASFEDCMQQLQQEEDTILRHMDEYSQVDDETENQVEEAPIKHERKIF